MLKQCKKHEPDGYFAYVHLKNIDQLDGELIKADVQKIKEELQIPGVGFHDAYFRYIDGDISMENVLLLMAFVGIVLVGGCVVIQSIFRISIIDKIKVMVSSELLVLAKSNYAYCKKKRTLFRMEGYVYRDFTWFRSDTFVISQRFFFQDIFS